MSMLPSCSRLDKSTRPPNFLWYSANFAFIADATCAIFDGTDDGFPVGGGGGGGTPNPGQNTPEYGLRKDIGVGGSC
jgi:hypothetical protein